MELKSPNQLNGVQLQQELKDAGIKFKDYPRLNDGILSLDIATKDEAKAKAIVNAHVGIDKSAEIAAQRQEILDRIGLTADELQVLLG